eukprot:gnl/TRDRNA2_/TRDRNA2_177553_c2_seq1.p3 gnl/TRDRNA2_/TRDRNA2_177553_c2~~gnl/TRDRNA2_/TRDRNA2_177553_c2_seq1.p3  ORF type:complete len:108 (-),score=17.06 gnl/TRDRNA2_/TRDRNA2_177553_c2_seq1:12-335(-)
MVTIPKPLMQKASTFGSASPALQERYTRVGHATHEVPAPAKFTKRSARSSRREYVRRGGVYHCSGAWSGWPSSSGGRAFGGGIREASVAAAVVLSSLDTFRLFMEER